jgi:hypothetical protein
MHAWLDSQQLSARRLLRQLAASPLILALLLPLDASPSTGASSHTCRVQNGDTRKTYGVLQDAVDTAQSGSHLSLRGTCIGKTVIDKRLVIEGVTTERSGPPKLTRNVKPLVLEVRHRGRVKLWGLVVVLGASYPLTGMYNAGHLLLRDVVVRRNRRCTDGTVAVFNGIDGFLSLRGSSSISRNRCHAYGRPGRYGGGAVRNDGTLVMHDTSSIFDNRGRGLTNTGRVTMNDMSSIRVNRALDDASGGVWNDFEAVFTMNGASTISENSGSYSGGVTNLGTFTMNDQSSIHDNHATVGSVGGFMNWGTLTMNGDASIVGNTAVTQAGGLRNGGAIGPIGTRTLVGVTCGPGGNVVANSPDDCDFDP